MRFVALFVALLAPVTAQALSCVQPSVVRSYAQFDAAPEAYVIVHGRLTLDERDLPKGMTTNPPPPELTRVPARLRGASLAQGGFVVPYDQAITLAVSCLGPWCGGARNGTDVLAFLRKDADGYTIEVSPCGGSVFAEPKPEMLRQMRRCFEQGDCAAD